MVSNQEDLDYIHAQQEKRLIALKFIWKKTRDNVVDGLSIEEINEVTGLKEDDLPVIIKYLLDEKLITAITTSTLNGWYCGDIKISHSGKLEMEAATSRPNERTNHFPSSVIINVQNMNQTTINAGRDAIGNISGSENKATVTNTIQTTDTDFILKAIAELKQQIDSLPQERQSIASEAITNIEVAINNPTLLEKAKSSLWTLWGLGQGVASFINAVTAIAQRFGVDFNSTL
jgi:hypothetical protein